MSALRSRVAGRDALRRRLAALPAAAAAAVAPALLEVAEAVADDLRASLDTRHGAASPADARDDPQGGLAGSVSAAAAPRGSGVTVGAPEAALLEYGTLRRPARPVLRAAALGCVASARTRLAAALRRGLAR